MEDTDPNRLITVGLAMCISLMASDLVVQWLKEIGSRPRYKYLRTLEDPLSAYRNWWQMMPYTAGENGELQSWPSGHMSVIGVLFVLLLCGYNRIHMTYHFLSDVCFGTLDAFLITMLICTVCLRIAGIRWSEES